ncbi:hypothetical protein Y032_0265g670 [Ancylostoma ceylanicum]|uniref:Uncharacterized protein n=1 Tax=Ancylostoma ceylanicum TaxID=53326 RepID=A0A016SAM3_9BILA|nr:hypothetical protein Y032_0265g670 [Ancylostoma ceylanicum]
MGVVIWSRLRGNREVNVAGHLEVTSRSTFQKSIVKQLKPRGSRPVTLRKRNFSEVAVACLAPLPGETRPGQQETGRWSNSARNPKMPAGNFRHFEPPILFLTAKDSPPKMTLSINSQPGKPRDPTANNRRPESNASSHPVLVAGSPCVIA